MTTFLWGFHKWRYHSWPGLQWNIRKTKKNDTYSQTRFQAGIKGTDDPADHFDRAELKHVLAETIKTLSKKEQMVVSLYYYDELTLKEIGEVLSLTESRICQIHTAVLIKLRTRLEDYVS